MPNETSTGTHVLVLGASGFVGREVLAALLLNRENLRISAVYHHNKPETTGIRLVKSDLKGMDWSLFDQDPPEIIIHLARINSRRGGKWGRRLAARRGYRANKALLAHMERKGWNSRITYVSGSLMYGDCGEEPVFEDHALNPVSFAREYVHAEMPFLEKDKNVRMIRLPWVFGEGSWFEGFYLKIMKAEKRVPCYGPGNNRMAFIEAGDAGRQIASIALQREPGVYHLAMETPVIQKDFCNMLASVSGLAVGELPLNGFEPALQEAFTVSIRLDSRDAEYRRQLHYPIVEDLVRSKLPLFLKNK